MAHSAINEIAACAAGVAFNIGYCAATFPACRLPKLEEGAGSDISGHGQGEDKSRFEELHRLVGLWSGGGVGRSWEEVNKQTGFYTWDYLGQCMKANK